MTPTPTTAAPDPVRIAEALCDAKGIEDYKTRAGAILGARAMQEAMSAQGGGAEPVAYINPAIVSTLAGRPDALATVCGSLAGGFTQPLYAHPTPEVKDAAGAVDDDPKEVRDLAWKMWREDQPGIIWTADNKKEYRRKARAALRPAKGGREDVG